MDSKYKKAEVKFNSGVGARICNGCGYILSYGFDHTDVEGYCGNCYGKLADAIFEIANTPPSKESAWRMKKIAQEAYRGRERDSN